MTIKYDRYIDMFNTCTKQFATMSHRFLLKLVER